MRRRRSLIGALLLLGIILALAPSPAHGGPTFSIGKTSASYNPVQPGVTTTITTSVTNTGTIASGIIVDMEIHDTAGKIVQQYTPGQTFGAGETKSFHWFWTVPPTQADATYVVKIYIFAARWAELYSWNNHALDLTVRRSGPIVAFDIASIVARPATIQPGQRVTLIARVTNTGTAPAAGISILLDLEDPLGQDFPGDRQGVGNVHFAPGESRTFVFQWTSSARARQGIYGAGVGVFGPGWKPMYAWKADHQAFTLGRISDPTFTLPQTTATPASVAHGGAVMVRVEVSNTSAYPAAAIVVNVQIHNSAGDKVLQQYVTGLAFAPHQTRDLTYVFQIPPSLPAGPYRVQIGVFNGTWSKLYVYDADAAAFTVTP